MISGEDDFGDDLNEPALEHQNAKFLYDTILKLKKQANLSQQPNLVLEELELLAPTTLITEHKADDQWYIDTSSGTTHTTWEARFRKIERGDAKLDKVGLGVVGAKGGAPVSTYTKKQQKLMWETSRRVTCSVERCQVSWRQFLSDSLLFEGAYRFVRDELWACYMAFCPFDTLTHLVKAHGYIELRKKYLGDAKFAHFLRDCYFNELRGIDKWAFSKKAIPISEYGSQEVVKQILRGYATSMMVLVSQRKAVHAPPLAEYEIGRFHFPTAGFNDGSMSEIEDLAGACEALLTGFAVVPVFKQIVSDLIEVRLSAPIKGETVSTLKPTADWRVMEIYDDVLRIPDHPLLDDFTHLRNLADGEYWNHFENLWQPQKIARHYKMPSYKKQVTARRRLMGRREFH